ncbi:alpha-2-macroglobulin family protein [Mesonia aquimarina]|uniref:alpha-2-macroglobulin family protein n=1 Tax=Mesonia aquimarina TaxID=1504967 RepID=UPI000EF63440|nr:MG2 domain-containing protein [Mesonia aquimarina]
MRHFHFLLSIFLCFSFIACDNSSSKKTDNLYQFREYISFHTQGRHSASEPIRIDLAKPLNQFESSQEIPQKYVQISPEIEGKLFVENNKTLLFKPSKKLQPNTEYTVSISLEDLYKTVEKEFEEYTFSFKTIEPNFKVELGNLQSYSKSWQYVRGTIESSDEISLAEAKQLLEASQNEENLSIKWTQENKNSRYFSFTIDSIQRDIDDSEILVSWNGKAIKADNVGSNTFLIPGQNSFQVIDVKTNTGEQSSVAINFSDPIDEQQEFSGLVNIQDQENLRFEVEGNVLNVYPNERITGKLKVEVFKGIKNTQGFALKQEFSEYISFEALKPSVKMISSGAILPSSANTPIYFKTVNLAAVDVRVIKIFENNVLQFLQQADLKRTDSYNLRQVGRKAAQKTIKLEVSNAFEQSNWKAHALNLSDLIRTDPGAIYQVEISFRKSYSTYNCGSETTDEEEIIAAEKAFPEEQFREEQYWDNELYNWRQTPYNWKEKDNPCSLSYYRENRFVRLNVLGSDLGLLVKESSNKTYHFVTTNLLNAEPEVGTKITLYNFQQQKITSKNTNINGFLKVESDEKAAFAIAKKGDNYAYAKLDDGNALSLSKFDVSGKKLQQGLKGFLYTERGVHRPGDSIHLTFVLNDKANPIPQEHPVQLSVNDARGKLVQQEILSEHKNPARAKNGMYYFPIATQKNDPTGNWTATVNIGGARFTKYLKVATVKPNRLKIKLDFDQEILKANQPISGNITSKWLHGAPARNLRTEVDVKLTPAASAFQEFKDYNFTDPVRDFETVEMKLVDKKLSEDGKTNFQKEIELNKKAPGMLQASFLSKVYEGGGDFSMDVFSKNLAPYSHFVGLKTPETKRYGSYDTDKEISFDVISLTDDEKPAANRKLQVFIYKIDWRWWWNRGKDNLSRYENTEVHRTFKELEVTTNSNGKANFSVNIPDREGGRFLIRVIDEKSGHATGKITYFYKNWWRNSGDKNSETAKMLVFSADKEEYKVGEEAVITFSSSENARALVSIENGSEVLSTQWIKTEKGTTKVSIPLTEKMAPNIYAHISLLQPHAQTKNDLPIRLYGVIPILVENPETNLHPELQMPTVLKPEEHYSVQVSEKNNKSMTYTLAVVDEGLLDLTRFATPDIHKAFYAREALGVKTFDIFDDVIGAFSGSVDQIYEIGGGDLAAGAKNRKADRFQPVVSYLGPFHLKAGETAKHKLWMPNYVGSVRTMLITSNQEKAAYGNAEKTVPVRKPLMVLSSLPRKLSPGEEVTLPVTVFAMEEHVKNVRVEVKADEAFIPVGESVQNISFDAVGEKIVNFKFKIKAKNQPQNIQVYVSGNGEKAKTAVEIDVENPNPISQKSTSITLEENLAKSQSFSTFGVNGTNSASIEFSTLPPMNVDKRMEYLIRYPHGCIEQTTSGALPQLFLSDVVDITFRQKKEIEENIKDAIEKLSDFQQISGGLSYWPGNRQESDWGTSYAGHFMLEAKQKGYALPVSFLSNWIRFQQQKARQWRNSYTTYNASLNQAYRLYTLALAGQPELAAMNRLRESGEMNNAAKWRLAAAYALSGKKSVAQKIVASATIYFEKNEANKYTYGSPFRNKAMALETMILLDDNSQRELAVSLAKGLSSQSWYSTQETAYALLSLSKMAAENGGKSVKVSYTINGKNEEISTEKSIAQRDLSIKEGENTIDIENLQSNIIYATISQSGKLPLGEELKEESKLSVTTEFLDAAGEKINVQKLRQGTEITAKVTVKNSSMDNIDDIALTQIFPSGWEIVNTSFTDFAGGAQGNATYKDIRDDRVNFYFDLDRSKSKVFTVKLNASYLGKYYLPGTQAEAMYDRSYFARNKGQWIEVKN